MLESIAGLVLALSFIMIVGYKISKRVERRLNDMANEGTPSTPAEEEQSKRDAKARSDVTFWAGL